MKNLDLTILNMFEWLCILLLAIIATLLLLGAVRSFQAKNVPINNKEKLLRSLKTGLWAGGFWVSCISALFIIYWANIGLRAALFVWVFIGGCTLPIMLLASTVGSFVQLTWLQKLHGTLDYFSDHERRNKGS
jgi:cytochrome c biogenesis protein CcdA